MTYNVLMGTLNPTHSLATMNQLCHPESSLADSPKTAVMLYKNDANLFFFDYVSINRDTAVVTETSSVALWLMLLMWFSSATPSDSSICRQSSTSSCAYDRLVEMAVPRYVTGYELLPLVQVKFCHTPTGYRRGAHLPF